MDRRSAKRIARRLPCELTADGQFYRGLVTNLSSTGLFVQTAVALAPGTLVEMRIEGTRFPTVEVQAEVVRRFLVPGPLASLMHKGVGLRIIDAPQEFYDAVLATLGERPGSRAQDEPVADAPAGEIVIEISVDGVPAVDVPALPPAVPEPEEAELPAVPMDPGEGYAGLQVTWGEPQADVDPEPDPVEDPEDLDEGAWDGLDAGTPCDEPALPYYEEAESQPVPLAVDVLVVDDGELDDVFTLLGELGADPVRLRPAEAANLGRFSTPPRALVASARSAMERSIASFVGADVATVAVAEGDSHNLSKLLLRQGFQYVVSRPVHRDALRLLLTNLIWRGSERRSRVRVPIGCELTVRAGWRRRGAVLLEVSAGGCSLLCEGPVPRGSRLTVRIPKDVTGDRALALSGRVVRAKRRARPNPDGLILAGLAFEKLSKRKARRLEELLRARAHGPVALHRASHERVEQPVEAPAVTDGEQFEHERAHPRAKLRHEAVALDADSNHVRHVLFGTELSLGGMRIEPHPDLSEGEELTLVLYSSACAASVVLVADVMRDEGSQGLALRFHELSTEAREGIEQIMAHPPEIELPDPRAGVVTQVVLAEVELRRRAAH